MKNNFKQPIGLTSAEVDQRTKEGKVNRAVNDQAKTTWQIIKENTFTYFNLIFLVLSILLVIVGEYNYCEYDHWDCSRITRKKSFR